jgi:pimeloyl-ACP methyl ester carboxylesterase
VLNGLEIERAHVLGHSFGGQVAQVFATSHPERVEALTVLCARSTPYPPFAAAAAAIERDGIQVAAEGALKRWFAREAIERDDPAVRYSRSRLGPEATGTLVATFRLIAEFDIRDRLRTLEAPARFIAAERDTVATPGELARAARLAPKGEFILERSVGHMLPVEAPEQLARLSW